VHKDGCSQNHICSQLTSAAAVRKLTSFWYHRCPDFHDGILEAYQLHHGPHTVVRLAERPASDSLPALPHRPCDLVYICSVLSSICTATSCKSSNGQWCPLVLHTFCGLQGYGVTAVLKSASSDTPTMDSCFPIGLSCFCTARSNLPLPHGPLHYHKALPSWPGHHCSGQPPHVSSSCGYVRH